MSMQDKTKETYVNSFAWLNKGLLFCPQEGSSWRYAYNTWSLPAQGVLDTLRKHVRSSAAQQ